MKRVPILAPSLLACDPGHMAQQMQEAERGGARRWHLDIMDGHFVENLSYGPHVCRGLKKYTALPFDAHLMVARPANHAEAFWEAGAASITIHAETDGIDENCALLEKIRRAGCLSGISICPETPVDSLTDILPHCDIALLMSVCPGKGGQPFLPGSLVRLEQLRRLSDRVSPECELQIDGGITLENVGAVAAAGADVLVAGSSVFGADDIARCCRAFCGTLAKSRP